MMEKLFTKKYLCEKLVKCCRNRLEKSRILFYNPNTKLLLQFANPCNFLCLLHMYWQHNIYKAICSNIHITLADTFILADTKN